MKNPPLKKFRGFLFKFVVLAITISFSTSSYCGENEHLFDANLQPCPELLQLLQLVGMDTSDISENPLARINTWAQQHLLRSGERWDEQSQRFETLKPQLLPLLATLGFVDTVFPSSHEYEGALVAGALVPRVRLRLGYLLEQWEQGIRFSHLYFLGGERPLESREREVFSNIQDPPTTECEMMQLLWDQSEISQDMREYVDVCFINSPMKEDPHTGKRIRPNTDDTIEDWLKTFPTPGNYLAVSNAPYIHRLDLLFCTNTSDEYTFDTVGPAADPEQNMVIFLDELARTIYHIYFSATKNNQQQLK